MATRKSHVVVLPYPAQGHLSPVLHLSKKLAAQGLQVTIVNVQSIHEKLLEIWKPEVGIKLEGVPFELDVPFGFDVQSQVDRGTFYGYILNLQSNFEEVVNQLDPPPSCILADELYRWHKATAKKLGVPSVGYWPGNATWNTVQHHLPLLVSNNDLPLKDGNKLVDYLPGASPIKVKHLPEYYHYVDKYSLKYYGHIDGQAEDCADFVFVNSFYELEPMIFDSMKLELGSRFVSVGPLFPLPSTDDAVLRTSLREEDLSCIMWLDGQVSRSVLYISFGSCSSMSRSEFEEFAHGLAASRQRFLWVLRSDLVADFHAAEIYERCKAIVDAEQGLLVPWAPQLAVLSHASVGGFVTHCGWNSVFESITYGVPMLGFPRHSDQSLNCKLMVEDWKVGWRLVRDDGSLERTEVARVVEEFMNNEETHLAVKKLRGLAMEAALPGGSSYNNIEAFIQAIKP